METARLFITGNVKNTYGCLQCRIPISEPSSYGVHGRWPQLPLWTLSQLVLYNTNKRIWYKKKKKKKDYYSVEGIVTYRLLSSFLTATGEPLMRWPRKTTPYPPSPMTLSFENQFVASSKSLSVNQWPQPRCEKSGKPERGEGLWTEILPRPASSSNEPEWLLLSPILELIKTFSDSLSLNLS